MSDTDGLYIAIIRILGSMGGAEDEIEDAFLRGELTPEEHKKAMEILDGLP